LDGPNVEEVSRFLKELKEIITQGRGLDVVPRTPNNQALIELGITETIRKEIILGLSVQNYSSGPLPDRDRPGEVWIFGTHIEQTEIYIKLKITSIGSVQVAKCISFHKAEGSLFYPLRD
jgi:hypothetical protein